MKTQVNSISHTSTPISKGIKLARLNERKRIVRDNQRIDAGPSKEIKSKSTAMLVACSVDPFLPDLTLKFLRSQLARPRLNNLRTRRKSKVPAYDYRQRPSPRS